MSLNGQCLFIQHACSMVVQQFFVLMDNLSLYYLNIMITRGIWLGNRNKAFGQCKKCNRGLKLLLQLGHPPYSHHPCFGSGTETPQKTAPVKPAWKYSYCNLWTEPIAWRTAWIQQNLLENRGGKKIKKNSSPHPHKAPQWRASVW